MRKIVQERYAFIAFRVKFAIKYVGFKTSMMRNQFKLLVIYTKPPVET